ncbi:hypothetical protein A2T82_13915 [Burkholderia cenocepacia]|uniref:hypothetical protein n=1 Tax=Burkholderia cenocepacia TaxID=95486 RepID=UPI00078C565C|nr:hypothetical protein [Burkholderia cenocepacia]AMU07318.1 hypothetical protein A2T82_13915 [Burkholderia cenocepacia]
MAIISKEHVYDELISPLMAQILSVCKDHKIAMLASFSIPTEEDPELACTSALIGGEFSAPASFRSALQEIRPDLVGLPSMEIRTDHNDGSVTMTAYT